MRRRAHIQPGRQWKLATVPIAGQWTAVAFNPVIGRFCVVGFGQTCLISDDGGKTWAQRTMPENNQYRAVEYVPDVGFVAMALNGTNRVAISETGDSWTARSAPAQQWAAITAGGPVIVGTAISGTQRAMYSEDKGITWSLGSGALSRTFFDVAYSEDLGMYLGVGAGSTSLNNKLISSTDGKNWTAFFSTTQQFLGVRWVPWLKKWIILAGDGSVKRILLSSDGQSFEAIDAPLAIQWEKLCFSDSILLGIASTGGGPQLMFSLDGRSWVMIDTPVAVQWLDIAAGVTMLGNIPQFVAVSFTGEIIYNQI